MIKCFQTLCPWCLGNRSSPSASQQRQNSTSSHPHCMQKCKRAAVVICHTCTFVFIHLCLLAPGRVRGSHKQLIGASESRGTVTDQTAEEGPEWQLHKIIGGLCNLDGCKMLCRLPSCRGSQWLTCVLSLRLTFCQVHLTVSLPGCHR